MEFKVIQMYFLASSTAWHLSFSFALICRFLKILNVFLYELIHFILNHAYKDAFIKFISVTIFAKPILNRNIGRIEFPKQTSGSNSLVLFVGLNHYIIYF